MSDKFRIVELSTRGIKKLEAVDIVFKDGVNVLMGLTQQGKTSLLDTLIMSLQGFSKGGPRELLTHGTDSGSIETFFVLNDTKYCAERILKNGQKPSVQVYEVNTEGKKIKQSSPQKFLNNLIPSFGETPGGYINRTALEKMKYVLGKHGIDMSSFEKKIETAKTESDTLTAQQTMFVYAKEPPSDPPAELTVIEADFVQSTMFNAAEDVAYTNAKGIINTKLTALESEYTAYTEKLSTFKPAETEIDRRKLAADFETREIKRLEDELAARKLKHEGELTSIETAENNLEQSKNVIKKVDEPDRAAYAKELEDLEITHKAKLKDTIVLEAEIANLKADNNTSEQYRTDHTRYTEKKEEITKANQSIRDARAEMYKALAAVPTKVEGMKILVGDEIRPDGIYVDDIFSEEWSGAQGFAIAAKIIRRYSGSAVLIIDHGESIYYDPEAFRKFCEWAKNDGVQVIISVVGEKMDPEEDIKGFIVEEGNVREISVTENIL